MKNWFRFGDTKIAFVQATNGYRVAVQVGTTYENETTTRDVWDAPVLDALAHAKYAVQRLGEPATRMVGDWLDVARENALQDYYPGVLAALNVAETLVAHAEVLDQALVTYDARE